MSSELFVKANVLKLRYKLRNGIINTEDLWDIPLTQLDVLAKQYHKKLKDSEEISFIGPKHTKDNETELKFEIVKFVIAYRLEAAAKVKEANERSERNERIKALINQKKESALGELSVEELEAMLKD